MAMQARLAGMEPAAFGKDREDAFNKALANALRQRRRAWRADYNYVVAERYQVLAGEPALRPDILIRPPRIYPVIVEVEFGEPAFGDARARLGKRVIGSPHPVRSAIAVGAPAEAAGWTEPKLQERLSQSSGLELRYAILSANVEGDREYTDLPDNEVSVWPLRPHYMVGTVDDLATVCEYAAAPPILVEQVAEQVSASIYSLAQSLHDAVSLSVAHNIAERLGQRDTRQGLRMACCIWLTALRLHNQLALNAPAMQDADLKTVAELRSEGGGVIALGDLRREWDKILSVNYRSVFIPARRALHDRLPDDVGAAIVTELGRLAERITNLGLGNRVNFAGELFPKLLDDRKETAAYYTLPETAELLATLAVDRMRPPDWSDVAAVASLQLADLSCGTGTLLQVAYQHIRRRHEMAGGDAEGMHRKMMEQGIAGLDINLLATHMTASGLASIEIETEYETSRIAVVPVSGGRTGSLELLAGNEVLDVLGEQVVSATANGEQSQPDTVSVPDDEYDLVIQNPPYTRARGGRKVFDVVGIAEASRKMSEKRLGRLRARFGKNITNGQAGMGADFCAVANRKLKQGGVFATVLPLTAAHAESWQGFRNTIETEYEDILAIAFTPNEGAMMSADTHMGEMLLLATKRTTLTPPPPPPQITMCSISITHAPTSAAEAFHYANLIKAAAKSGAQSGVLHHVSQRIGAWIIAHPRAGFPWFTVGMRNHHLAAAATELFRGRLYAPESRRTWELGLTMVNLGSVAVIGPTHHLIGHLRGKDPRGAFAFDTITPDLYPTYPALWSVDGATQKALLTQPTHDGEPSTDDEVLLLNMLDCKSDLFISRNLRLTSQSLAAARTTQTAMGGTAWNALHCDDEAVKASLAIWLNSTLGLLMRTCYAQTTQPGRARMQIKALAGFPVPDFAADSAAGELARETAQRSIGDLQTLTLEPASYAFRDKNRHRFDEATLRMAGLGDEQDAIAAVAALRFHWCREPAVHGGNHVIMRDLGIALT